MHDYLHCFWRLLHARFNGGAKWTDDCGLEWCNIGNALTHLIQIEISTVYQTLLQICCWYVQWKNFGNCSAFGKFMSRCILWHVFTVLCILNVLFYMNYFFPFYCSLMTLLFLISFFNFCYLLCISSCPIVVNGLLCAYVLLINLFLTYLHCNLYCIAVALRLSNCLPPWFVSWQLSLYSYVSFHAQCKCLLAIINCLLCKLCNTKYVVVMLLLFNVIFIFYVGNA